MVATVDQLPGCGDQGAGALDLAPDRPVTNPAVWRLFISMEFLSGNNQHSILEDILCFLEEGEYFL